jgi:hypothetical protein
MSWTPFVALMGADAVRAHEGDERLRVHVPEVLRERDRGDAAGEQVVDELRVGGALLGQDVVLHEQRRLVHVDRHVLESELDDARHARHQFVDGRRDRRVGGRIQRRVRARHRDRADELLRPLETLAPREERPCRPGRGLRHLLGRLQALGPGVV